MADTVRLASHALEPANAFKKALQEKPYDFDFFQVIRRFEAIHPDKPRLGEGLHASDDPVRLAQDPSLAFSPAALSSFDLGKEGQPPRLSVFFFGLFGPNGPLPVHLSEYARDRMRNEDDPTFVRFADLFHHRMLSLFYRARANAEPTNSFDRPESDRFSDFVSSLFGMGMPSLRNRSEMSDLTMLHYAGQYACQTGHAEGLKAILADFFKMPVQIESFIGQWIDLPDQYQCRLGESLENCALGQTITLGASVWTRQQKFRIVMGPMNFEDYERLFPGKQSMRRLSTLVRSYVGDELDWDVRLILKKEKVPQLKLNKTRQLGWTTWLNTKSLEKDARDLLVKPLNN